MAPGARRTRDELRTVLLDVGVDILLRQGLVGGAEHVTFSDVFAEAESHWGSPINPASVYKRIWASQSDFQRDVLMSAASFYPDGEEQPTLEAARRVLARSDLSTPGSRSAALSEICRITGDIHIRILEASRPWQIWVGIWALTVSTPSTADDELLGPAIQVGHDKATAALQAVLEEVIPAVGYRIDSAFTYEQLALAIGSLAEGLALRDRFATDRLRHIDRRDTVPQGNKTSRGTKSVKATGLEDRTMDGRASTDSAVTAHEVVQRWTLFGVAVEGLVRQFCEPMPKTVFRASVQSKVEVDLKPITKQRLKAAIESSQSTVVASRRDTVGT